MRYLKEPAADPFAGYSVPQSVQDTVTEIIDTVDHRGDAAIHEYTERFDDVDRDTITLTDAEQAEALDAVSETEKQIIDNSIENIRQFAQAQRDHITEFETEVDTGITLGQRIVPIERVGAYVPGGGYPLLSSALMSVIPAAVAGVDDITVATPPQADGLPHPAIVYGALESGADRICVAGGAQAIAGMALGTESVDPVDKIVGPGNVFVTEAKKQLYGTIGIDLLAGPSEILVIADETADPTIIAADLLAQAEHDEQARPLLVTTDETLGQTIIDELHAQLEELSTADIAEQSWAEKGAVIVADSLAEATAISNDLAPEHLEVQTENPDALLHDLVNYGTLFLGEHSANVFSDKLIGTNHILPTQRAARYTGGLSVHMFLKIVTHQHVTDDAAATLEPWATKQSQIEQLEGHAKSAYIRAPEHNLEQYPDTTNTLFEDAPNQ